MLKSVTKKASLAIKALLTVLVFVFIYCFTGCSLFEDNKEKTYDVISGTKKITVLAETESVTLNGANPSTATMVLDIQESEKPVTIYANNLNVTGEIGSSLISCSGNREIHIVVSGENSLQAFQATAINCPASNVYFEGDGSLNVLGGNGKNGTNGESGGADGKNGGNGFEAVIASKIYININNALTFVGGNGGNGGNGADGTNGTNGRDINGTSWGNTEVGGDAGNGGDGGNGGLGGNALRTTLLDITAGRVLLQGGTGGDGGQGGDGGKGGQGGRNDLDNIFTTHKGGYPGSGGNGGNGGNAAYGGNIDIEKTMTINSSGVSTINIEVGDNGNAGVGGFAGKKGDPSGDPQGDIVPPAEKIPTDGVDGVNGLEIEKN